MFTNWGIDADTVLTRHADALSREAIDNAPISFAGRYLSPHSRPLTADEARALTGAGIGVFSIFERQPTDVTAAFFTYDRGHDHGGRAWRSASALGQPAGSAIYIAIDTDLVGEAALRHAIDYLTGARQAFVDELAANPDGPGYRLGIYGSWDVLQTCLDNELVDYYWQAVSSGWSQRRNANDWPDANIRQYNFNQTVAGINVDYDCAVDDYGGWTLP